MTNKTLQNILRILLGLFMIIAGIGHLTFQRVEFQSLVPSWLHNTVISDDLIVISSGIIEICLGIGLIFVSKYSVQIGITLAIFFILIFPGNVGQYIDDINIFGLDTDHKRLLRLLFQPILILWALWSTDALKYLFRRQADNNNISIYDFEAKSLQGKMISLSDYKGKVILIVNTASKCGLTPQYEELENLYQKYKDKGLVILGFPCNQFAKQEAGTADDIAEFCQVNYGVTFTMFDKVNVNGKDAHPLFKYLRSALPGDLGNKIKWNFTKFVIDKNGIPTKRFAPYTKPHKIEPLIREMTKI